MRGSQFIYRAAAAVCVTLVAVVAADLHAPALMVFLLSALSIILLAQWIGVATEVLSSAWGPTLGALIGVTFGNSVELIIAIIALRDGLYTVVKASIIGSVLANLLLTLGVCMTIGGVRSHVQQFSRQRAGVNSVMLFLAVSGLTITSIAAFLHQGGASARTVPLSVGVAVVFLVVYVASFVFSLVTHRSFLAGWEGGDGTERRALSTPVAVSVLIVTTVLVALISDRLVATVTPLGASFGLSQQFIGLILIPLIGIAPEFLTAVMLARRDQLDGSVEIAVGSSLQIALFVAPLLVVIGLFFSHPLTLVFPPVEVAVIFLATILVSLVSLDGETNWYEGVMVTATYVIFALLFYFE